MQFCQPLEMIESLALGDILKLFKRGKEFFYANFLLLNFLQILFFTFQGINSSALKRLYFLLNCLCSKMECCATNGVGINHLTLEIGNDSMKVTTEDICGLSDVLFQELSRKFEEFFSAVFNPYSSKELGDDSSTTYMWGTVEIVSLLLRCCLVMLNLLQYQQNNLLIKGQVLLGIFQKLRSVNFSLKKEKKGMRFEKSIYRSCRKDEDGCTTSSMEDLVASLHFLEPSHPRRHFMSAIIEVIQALKLQLV